MFDTFQGLPVHALVLHATVLAVPVAALLTVLVAFAPRWRARGAWPVVAVDAVVTALVYATQQSGEQLERRLGASPLVERHAEMGDLMLWFMLAVLAAAVLVALARADRPARAGARCRDPGGVRGRRRVGRAHRPLRLDRGVARRGHLDQPLTPFRRSARFASLRPVLGREFRPDRRKG